MEKPNGIILKIEYGCYGDNDQQTGCKHYEPHPTNKPRCMFRQSLACMAPWAQKEALRAFMLKEAMR